MINMIIPANTFSLFRPLSLLIIICSSSLSIQIEGLEQTNYIEYACSVTQYYDICIRSLASFSSKAKHNPSKWARAGVSVTIGEAKEVAQFLAELSNNGNKAMMGRTKMAVLDCVECLQDTLDNLHHSLDVLRNLTIGEFNAQMADVTTWVSAALTDEETCLDGFQGRRVSKMVDFLIGRVSRVTYMTSNALALVNKLATNGPKGSFN